jgi:hypothetical protein
MQKSMILAASAAFIVSGSVFAQDIPDPNPVQNTDGTFTWYTGNNTQYPVIQDVLDACTDGDEVVVMEGQYVESLIVNRNDISLRPATERTALGFDGQVWQTVVFWNPTEGFNNNNGSAILAGDNTSNTYVGRPREFKQLANGSIMANQAPFANTAGGQEWLPLGSAADGAALRRICTIAYTDLASMSKTQLGQNSNGDMAMVFWSRSINDVAVRTNDSAATFSYCDISSQNGFGGGVMVTGDTDATSFVGCKVSATWSGGQTSDGQPVHAVTIAGGHPMFAGCQVTGNIGGADGIIRHTGGEAQFTGCSIDNNQSPVSDGIYKADGGAHATFAGCDMSGNLSRFGTIWFDSSACAQDEYMMLSDCVFSTNTTVDGQYGATAFCTDAVAGRSPLLVIDRCQIENSNPAGTDSGSDWFEKDVESNYFPDYRILRDMSNGMIVSDSANSIGAVGTAANEGATGNALAGDINGDDKVDGMDLAALLANWS